MKLNTYEIELLLRLYPRLLNVNEDFTVLEIDFKSYIINSVELWLTTLYTDEIELIKLRFFDRKSYDHIAGYLGYKNHSSVIKKLNQILKKIEINFYK